MAEKNSVAPEAGDAGAATARVDRNHPVVKAWRHQLRDHITCDLCQEPVRGDGKASDSEWVWIEDGWSLACWPCINRAASLTRGAAATRPAGAPERSEIESLRTRVSALEGASRELIEAVLALNAYFVDVMAGAKLTHGPAIEARLTQALNGAQSLVASAETASGAQGAHE